MFTLRHKRSSLERDEARNALLFVLPFVCGFLLFRVVPVFAALLMSVANFNTLKDISTIKILGFDNFIRIFQDEFALQGYWKSFQYMLMFVPGFTIISMLLALFLSKDMAAKGAGRTMIFVPYVSNFVAVAMIWSILLEPFSGPINTILRSMGVENPPMWLAGLKTALPTIVMIVIWQGIAFPTVVFLAAINEVPKDLYESARIDGANKVQQFFKITLPLISPTTFFLVITGMIGSFQNYTQVQVLTKGGPGTASRVIAVNIYETAFTFNQYSYASAQAILLFLIILGITIIQWKGQKRWVHY
ncbi:MAG: carbohydrate ABC transporter permease [Spirochaetia bacterium]